MMREFYMTLCEADGKRRRVRRNTGQQAAQSVPQEGKNRCELKAECETERQ